MLCALPQVRVIYAPTSAAPTMNRHFNCTNWCKKFYIGNKFLPIVSGGCNATGHSVGYHNLACENWIDIPSTFNVEALCFSLSLGEFIGTPPSRCFSGVSFPSVRVLFVDTTSLKSQGFENQHSPTIPAFQGF